MLRSLVLVLYCACAPVSQGATVESAMHAGRWDEALAELSRRERAAASNHGRGSRRWSRHHRCSSGAGKSSLVAAGLLPKLQSAAEHGEARYLVRKMRPGAEPLVALASAFEVEAAEASPETPGCFTYAPTPN